MPDTAFLIALLQAKSDGDDDTVSELTDILRGDPEHAEALLEEARGGMYGKSSEWDEKKHPRADDGKFGIGGGGGGESGGGEGKKIGKRRASPKLKEVDFGPPPKEAYTDSATMSRLADEARSYVKDPSLRSFVGSRLNHLAALSESDDVPQYLRDRISEIVAHHQYDDAKRQKATELLADTPPEQMTADVFYQLVRAADPEAFAETGLHGYFFRSGDLPAGGFSRNHQTGQLEDGVSVYATPRATSMAGLTSRGIYFGKGEFVGTGSDDEPLIKPSGKWERLGASWEDAAKKFHRKLVASKQRESRTDTSQPAE